MKRALITIGIILLWTVPLSAGGVYRASELSHFYGETFNNPVSVFFDEEREELYVLDNGRGEVFIFDERQTPLFRFKTQKDPVDIVVKGDTVFVSGEDGKVLLFDYRGRKIGRLDIKGARAGRMALDSEGTLYVVDKESKEVLLFRDRLKATIGSGLSSISGIAVGGGRVYIIAPFDTPVIRVFDRGGRYLMGFEGLEGRGGTLGLPVSGEVDDEGNLWIVDALRGIVVYTRNGKEIMRFGDLNFPLDIAFGRGGKVYIVEKGAKKVAILRRD